MTYRALTTLLLVVASAASPAGAQIVSLDLSSDIVWSDLAAVDDQAVVRLEPPASSVAIDVGSLPTTADLVAYDPLDDGRRLFSLDTAFDLGGGVVAGPEDLVAWNGTVHSLHFDGSAAGVPRGARVDAAAHVRAAGVLRTLVSFDVTVALPGGLVADDEDVVAWNGSTWSLFFDGSEAGVPAALDLDGLDLDPVTQVLYLSFDGSGAIGPVAFDDEDVLAFDGATWSLAFDASDALGASFAVGDLDALGVRTIHVFADGFESGTTIEWSLALP
jgi:hypothetical protein